MIRHFLLHYLSNSNNLEKTRKSRLRKVTNLSLENPSSHIKVSNQLVIRREGQKLPEHRDFKDSDLSLSFFSKDCSREGCVLWAEMLAEIPGSVT